MPRSGIEWYNEVMDIRSASHTRYNIQYHFVWIVKYRKSLLDDERGKALQGILTEIGQRYWFEIIRVGTDGNHVHLFVGAAPRYAPATIMKIIKSITAREMFRRYQELRKDLWGGEFWGDGYYVGTVGDGVTAEIIKAYIDQQGKITDHKPFEQLRLL